MALALPRAAAREPPKLRSQLLTWLLIPLFLLLVIDSFVSYSIAVEFSRRAYDRSLLDVARELALHVRNAPGGPALMLPADSRQILLSDPQDRVYFEVDDFEGRLIEGQRLPAPEDSDASAQGGVFYDSVLERSRVRVVELRLQGDAATDRPGALVRVAETLVKRNQFAREILLSVVVPQALIILVAVVVVWVGIYKGLLPLERLRGRVAARPQRDWSPIVADDVPAEVRPLLDSMNELVGRLDATLKLQNRFISDAAHQLKTPVAALKTQFEVALREEDPERMRQAFHNAREGLERLSRVISQLLSLARNEPEAVKEVVLEPMDLNAFALEAGQEWVPQALRRRIDLGFEPASQPVTIRGDAARLRVLLDNLLDNAVRYTREGGHVTLRVRSVPAPALEVNDDGAQIPAEERGRIFERFHRLLGTTEEGSGLGLAIAREVARLHGAMITLDVDDDGVGNSFRVTFPAPRD